MKELIIENMELIITLLSMLTTWILGMISKKSTKISNKLIPYQNIVIAIISSLIYYWATGSFSMVVATGSPVATLIYDAIHQLKKEE